MITSFCFSKLSAKIFFVVSTVFLSIQVNGETLSFDWKDGQKGMIRSKIMSPEGVSVLRYEVTTKDISASEIEILFSNAAFETAKGFRSIDVAKTLPSIVVTKEGGFSGLKGVGDANRKIFEQIPLEVAEESRRNWEQQINNPVIQKTMAEHSQRLWNSWVGSWSGLDIKKDYGFPSGRILSIRSRDGILSYEYLGSREKVCESCIKLRCTNTLDGERAIDTVRAFLQQRTNGYKNFEINKASSRTITDIVTDATKLMPYYVKTTTHVIMLMEGIETVNREISREYWFDWY